MASVAESRPAPAGRTRDSSAKPTPRPKAHGAPAERLATEPSPSSQLSSAKRRRVHALLSPNMRARKLVRTEDEEEAPSPNFSSPVMIHSPMPAQQLPPVPGGAATPGRDDYVLVGSAHERPGAGARRTIRLPPCQTDTSGEWVEVPAKPYVVGRNDAKGLRDSQDGAPCIPRREWCAAQEVREADLEHIRGCQRCLARHFAWRQSRSLGCWRNFITEETSHPLPKMLAKFGEYQDVGVEYAMPELHRTCARLGLRVDAVPYGRELGDANYPTKISGRAAKLGHCLFYGHILAKELALYPPEIFKVSHVRKLVFAQKLHWRQQQRLAIPNIVSGVMYIDPFPMYTLNYMIRCFHHELMHMIDYKMVGGYSRPDPDWEALNPPGTKYGTGGKNNRDSNAFLDKIPNFINAYAQSAVEEDKAETWSAMVVQPAQILKHKNRIIRSKALELQRRCAALCPAMGKDFWERCQARAAGRKAELKDLARPCRVARGETRPRRSRG